MAKQSFLLVRGYTYLFLSTEILFSCCSRHLWYCQLKITETSVIAVLLSCYMERRTFFHIVPRQNSPFVNSPLVTPRRSCSGTFSSSKRECWCSVLLQEGGWLAFLCPHQPPWSAFRWAIIWFHWVIFSNHHLHPAMWRTLLNFLRLTYWLPRMHSHAQGLFGTSETVRGAQVYQSHWYHAGGREGMLMLPYGHSDRFRGHSFTQQTLTEDRVLHQALDIVKMWGGPPGALSLGVETQKFTKFTI